MEVVDDLKVGISGSFFETDSVLPMDHEFLSEVRDDFGDLF
jgi:hypothetical protein